MNRNELKSKIDVFDCKESLWVMMELLKEYDKAHGVPVNESHYYNYHVQMLKFKYKKQWEDTSPGAVNVRQIDLEEVINENKKTECK